MKKISFDFDNTIAMGYMELSVDPQKPVFQGYNDKIIKKIKKHIKNGDDIYIVTARTKELEGLPEFFDQNVEYHLEKLGLKNYFWPDRVIYTAARPKYEILSDLGVEKHYDDSIEEHFDGLKMDYKVIQPLDDYKDSESVGKVSIFDMSDRILILQRADKGNYWDLPGGHLKHVEIARGEQGYEDGTDREVFEETGLLLPFLKEYSVFDFDHKGITHKIHMYLSKIDSNSPDIRLDLQDHIENIDYKWVTLEELESYLPKSTTNLRKSYDILSIQDEIFEHTEPYQLKMKRKHRNMKRKLIGYGKNKHFGGGKGHSRPDYTRSKSSPAGFGGLEEQNDEKNKKKVKIKIKTIKKQLRAAIIKGNPEHLKKNPDISKKFYGEIAQILKNQGFLVDFHESEAYSWPGKPNKMVYDLWIGHSLGSDRLEGAVEGGYTRKAIGFGVPNPEKQPFLALNHPNDDPEPGKISGIEHYSLSDDMKGALLDIIDELNGDNLDEKRKKRRKKRKKSRKRRGYGGYYPYYDLYGGGDSGDSGGDGGE